jgi:hypothetical protein
VNPNAKGGKGVGHSCVRPTHLMVASKITNTTHELMNIVAQAQKPALASLDDCVTYATALDMIKK